MKEVGGQIPLSLQSCKSIDAVAERCAEISQAQTDAWLVQVRQNSMAVGAGIMASTSIQDGKR